MTDLSISKIITHHYHVNGDESDKCIGYGMIIGCYLMVQLGMIYDFKCNLIEWDVALVIMKYPGNITGSYNLDGNTYYRYNFHLCRLFLHDQSAVFLYKGFFLDIFYGGCSKWTSFVIGISTGYGEDGCLHEDNY